MRKNRIIVLALLLLPFIANAQEQPTKSFWDRIYFGGNLGLGFGTNSTYVDVSPQVGYKITDRFSAGVGVTYIYYKEKFTAYGMTYKYETSIYGGDIFSRYFFTESLFGHVETGALNLDVPEQLTHYPYTVTYGREWVPNLLVGGGFRSGGEKVSFMIMLLYDLIDDPNSPYQNPILRIGFGIGM